MLRAVLQLQALSLQAYGPLFRDLHKLFDGFADDVLENLDPIAERIRMIGQDRPRAQIELADLATVTVAAPHSTMREIIDEARRNLLIVIKEIRQAAKVADGTTIREPSTCLHDLFRSTRSTSGGRATSFARMTVSARNARRLPDTRVAQLDACASFSPDVPSGLQLGTWRASDSPDAL